MQAFSVQSFYNIHALSLFYNEQEMHTVYFCKYTMHMINIKFFLMEDILIQNCQVTIHQVVFKMKLNLLMGDKQQ